MEAVNLYSILILILQCFLVAFTILFLFRTRNKLGISILYAALGLFQYLQTFLASTVYIQIAENIIVSPGSSVLFVGSLFAVILIYIKEDATETRKVIYALLIANIIMSVLLFTFGWNFNKTTIYNPLNVSERLFDYNAWLLIDGTITLFIDSILIIILYELISKLINKPFFRIYITMALVLSIDSLIFYLLAFGNYSNFQAIFLSGFISKNGAVIIYSVLFYIYLKYIEKDKTDSNSANFRDIFHLLTYKQKYEIVETERKDAEQKIQISEIKYKTLADTAPVGIFRTDASGNTTFVNKKWTEISGVKADNALGYEWIKAMHPDDKEKLIPNWTNATIKKESSTAEYRFIHPDGTIRWVLGLATPEIDSNNIVIGYVGTITDITAIKNYENDLKHAKEKAEEGERLKTMFLHNMSHEIRTPLNSILGFSEFLTLKEFSLQTRKKYAAVIQKSSHRLLSTVSDIIIASEIQTRQTKLFLSKIIVNDFVKSIYEKFKPKADKRNISFFLTENIDKKIEIFSDKKKLLKIIVSLLVNAFKYTNEGYIELGYGIKKNSLEFYIKDTGIGIEEEHHNKIFNNFTQADKNVQYDYGGTGLGLFIAKGYVETLGGKIWLNSENEKGSTFYFTIPLNK